MATKEELIQGLDVLIVEARRLARDLSEKQWESVVDFDGWKNKEVLAHVAGIGGIVVPVVTALAGGSDIMAGNDINVMNAGMVTARAGVSAKDLGDEVATAYTAVIEFIRSTPDETLSKHATIGGHRDLPLSDVLMRIVVLHGIGHIYSVYSGIFFAPA